MSVVSEASKYFKRQMPGLVAASFLGLVGVFVALLAPQVIGLVIDKVMTPVLAPGSPVHADKGILAGIIRPYISSNPGNFSGILWRLALMFGVIEVSRYVIHYTRWNMAHGISVNGERVLRKAVFKRMITQNTVFLNKYTAGELLSISNGDIVMVKDMFAHYIPFILESIATIAISGLFLVSINVFFLILPFVMGVVMVFFTVRYTRLMKKIFDNIRSANVELNSCVTENINGVRVIRAFAREDYERKKFDSKNENYRETFNKYTVVWSKYSALFYGLSQVVWIGSLALGIVFVIEGKISIGDFSVFMAYVVGISNPMMNIANFAGALQQCSVAGTRMFTFLNTYNAIKDPEQPVPIKGKEPHIQMSGATLQLDDKTLLRHIDLDIPYGKSVGIMGKTGAGKSALLKTFMRFFETTKGVTKINGIDIKLVSIDDLRAQFSYVPQDVFLFSNTVDSNIAFADPDCPKESVVAAAKAAEADGFIQKLPEGYETIVGEKGLGLSGGQKQRVSIARALLKNAPIIVLDDSTSALDMETEHKVFANIRGSYAGRTMLIAAHRASSVASCDEILYMEDGEIVERGNFAELMALNGKYAAIYRAQSAESSAIL